MATIFTMKSGIKKSYPTNHGITKKFRRGLSCLKCGKEFVDGDKASRTNMGGFIHIGCESTTMVTIQGTSHDVTVRIGGKKFGQYEFGLTGSDLMALLDELDIPNNYLYKETR